MPIISSFTKRDISLTQKDGSLNWQAWILVGVGSFFGLIFLALAIRGVYKCCRRRRSSGRQYSVQHAKRNSDTGHLLEEPWLDEGSKAELPTFTTYRSDAPSTFQFAPETFRSAAPPLTSTARYSSLIQTTPEEEEKYRRTSFSNTPTPRPPSSVIMLETLPIPFMREGSSSHQRSPSYSPPRSPMNLPPLVIPGAAKEPNAQAVSTSNYAHMRPVAVMDTPISGITSATSDTASVYSQASASTARHRHTLNVSPPSPIPPVPPIPKLPLISDGVLRRVQQAEFPVEESELNRAPTKFIATLVKKRAKGVDLDRNGTTVSRIERSDSIKSFDSPSDEEEEEMRQRDPVGYRHLKTTRRKWEEVKAKKRMDTIASEAELEDVPITTTTTAFPSYTAPLRIQKNSP
ncbi:hypothetical protein BDZ89DRAFT_1081038 [Hymenopellis radicata]|nr:hypothetical protein BDZ89DRAFT_1081038 [Hymenopellis radicata]